MSTFEDLPENLARQLMSFFTKTDGDEQVTDMGGLISFIAEHGKRHPFVLTLVSVNEEAVIKHFEDTGEVPPGVKLIGTTTEEGSKVTHLEILQGPIPPRK